MDMVKKGQVNNLNYSGLDEVKYILQLFEIVLSFDTLPSDILPFIHYPYIYMLIVNFLQRNQKDSYFRKCMFDSSYSRV